MEDRISPAEEKNLTNAIETAATLASANESLDRDVLLADQLKKAHVDSRFAKAASAAFNKRLTVLTFKKTADEHKGDSFKLTDADRVYSLVAGTVEEPQEMPKAAYAISMNEYQPTMDKAASAAPSRPAQIPYEKRVTVDRFMTHIESMLEKHAAKFGQWVGFAGRLASKMDKEAKEVADAFAKDDFRSFDFRTAANLYGDDLKGALEGFAPSHADFTKKASAIAPKTKLFEKIAQLVKDYRDLEDVKAYVGYYGKGLTEFAKTAAAYDDIYLNARAKGLIKEGAPLIADIGGQLLGSITGAGAAALGATGDALNTTVGAAEDAFGNARKLYLAGNDVSLAPGRILDAEFLTKDRYRDRMLGWSDMAADQQFAMYPAEQVFQATQKAMDMDTSLERPDRRELLRTQVAQLLAQNNRVSTADMAALATALRYMAQSSPSAAVLAAEPVYQMDKTSPAEEPELTSPVKADAGKIDTTKLHEATKNINTSLNKNLERIGRERDQARTRREEAARGRRESASRAAAERTRAIADARNARQNFLTRGLHIRAVENPTSHDIEYRLPNGTVVDQTQIDALLARAEAANLVPPLPA